MKTKNKLLTLLVLSAGAAATTSFINKCIKISAISRDLLKNRNSYCYHWRLGDIHYTKTGSGKPLLLIHDLHPTSSSYEWINLIDQLKSQYTVYTLDLLGCGKSEKPNLTYTNYLYVQLISEFIKSEIGHRTDVVATGKSTPLVTMACSYNEELFDKLIFINPESVISSAQVPNRRVKLYKAFLDLPIIGTLIYHIANSKDCIKKEFIQKYFYNPYSVKPSYIDAYYESSHLGDSPKSIFSSTYCNYTKCNIISSLKKINNSIYLIGSSEIENNKQVLNEYQLYNPSIEIAMISQSKYLPQLEKSAEVTKLIKMFIS